MPRSTRPVATLRVAGADLDPDEVTRLLDQEPTFAQIGLWSYADAEASHRSLDEQIQTIVAALTDDLEMWRQLVTSSVVDLVCDPLPDGSEDVSILAGSLHLLTERGINLVVCANRTSYPQSIEALAHQVTEEAAAEGWLTFLPEDEEQPPLQRAVNELARNLRFQHHVGDGCLDH